MLPPSISVRSMASTPYPWGPWGPWGPGLQHGLQGSKVCIQETHGLQDSGHALRDGRGDEDRGAHIFIRFIR